MLQKIKNKITNLIQYILQNKFNICLIFILLLIFIYSKKTTTFKDNYFKLNNINQVKIFVQDGCYHCNELEKFLKTIDISKYDVIMYNLTKDINYQNLLIKYINKHNIPLNSVGTPIIFYNNGYTIGFQNTTNGQTEIIDILESSKEVVQDNSTKSENNNVFKSFVKICLLQAFGFYNSTILLLLISLMILINNKNRTRLLFICFFTSFCVVNFLFLTSWLNAITVARWTRLFNLILGLFVLFYSVKQLYFVIGNKNINIFESSREKLSNFLLLSTICLSFITNITNFAKSEALFKNYTNYFNEMNIILKIIVFSLTSIISIIIPIIIVFLCYKLLENYLFNNNNYSAMKKNIFSSILFVVGIYLTFIITY